MDSLRTTKVARLIQKELGEMLLLESKKVKGLMLTVSEVRLSSDLSIARVYVSIFPDDEAERQIRAIRENASTIRYDLGRRMGNQLRRIPELVFYLDTSARYAERIDKLLGLCGEGDERS